MTKMKYSTEELDLVALREDSVSFQRFDPRKDL